MTKIVKFSVSAGAKAHDGSEPTYSFVLCSGNLDHYNDRILVSGVDVSDFQRNPIALYMHSTTAPIGTWKNLRKTGSGFDGVLRGDLVLAPAGASKAVDEARALLGAGVLRAASVGMLVKRSKPNEYGGEDILESVLVETSIVSIPANGEALLAAALGARRDARVFVVNARDLAEAIGGALGRAAGQAICQTFV